MFRIDRRITSIYSLIYVVVQIFLWLKSVQSSLLFILLCFSCLTHYPVPRGGGGGGGGTPLSGGDARPDGVWVLVFKVFCFDRGLDNINFCLNGVSLHGLRC